MALNAALFRIFILFVIWKDFTMGYFIIILLFIMASPSIGQSHFGSKIATYLPKSQFYFVGQAHNNEANTIIENELLIALNSKYNVQYDILEYCHSAAFLINQYLKTGNESFLKIINPEAKFNFIKAIKAHNDTIDKNRNIQFYGLDFENRNSGKYTQKALKIILEQLELSASEVLSSVLTSVANCQPKEIEANLSKLKSYLKENDHKCRGLLNNYYLDVLLIANAQFNFSPRRDASMMENFKRLYAELARDGKNPSFFASFGTGHINPKNHEGIGIKLMSDDQSPVKDSVCILGIQYFNCFFNRENISKSTNGSLSSLCKISEVSLSVIEEEKNKSISFLPKEKLNMLKCNRAIKNLSGLIVVRNFGATIFWTWE
jgi:hypothetical protein